MPAQRVPAGSGGRCGQAVSAVNRALDGAVVTTHRLFPGRYHPYHVFEDLTLGALIALGFAFQTSFGHLDGWVHALAISATFVFFATVYLRIKRRLTGTGARSFLQDSLACIFPMYLALSWALGQGMRASLDALALSMLLAGALMRIGCFLGGCCFGAPSRLGVVYPHQVLRSVEGARLYSCGAVQGVRVFPLQLVDAAVLLLLFTLGWVHEGTLAEPDGSTLEMALFAYPCSRFFLEFFRGHRHRPMYLGLSESQWICLALVGTSGIAMLA